MRKKLILIFSLALLLWAGSANAQFNRGFSSPTYWKLSASILSPINSSWTVNIPTLTVGVITMSGNLDMDGNCILLDGDADTYVCSSVEDTIDVFVNSARDFLFTANTFTATSGSNIIVQSGYLGRDSDNLINFSTDNEISFDTNGNQVITIDSSGNFGIGTSTPEDTLWVKDGVGVFDGTSPYDTLAYIYDSDDDGILDLYADDSVTVKIHGNGSSYFNSGNVGIATTVPAYELDIKGTTSASFYRGDGRELTFGYGKETLLQIFEDTLNKGIFDAVTITDEGGVRISWSAGEIYDETNATIVDTVASSSTACADDNINYLNWVSGTALTLSTSEPSHDEVGIAVIYVQDGDILAVHTESLVSDRESGIKEGLSGTFPTIVTEGLIISEDTDATNAFDVQISAGVYFHNSYEKHEVEATTSRALNLTTWCDGDVDTIDDVINPENWCDTGTISSTTISKYYGWLFFQINNNIHAVVPETEYANLNAAIVGGCTQALPTGLIGNPKTTCLILSATAAALPTAGGDQWIDARTTPVTSPGGTISDHGNLSGLSDDDHTIYLELDGSDNFGGDLNFGGYDIVNITEFTAASGTFTTIIGALTGDVTGDLTGNVTGNADTATALTGTWDGLSTTSFLLLTGGTMSGDVNMGDNSIMNMDEITVASGTITAITGTLTGDLICTDCLNATEIEDIYLLLAGGTLSGEINMGGQDIVNIDELTVASTTITTINTIPFTASSTNWELMYDTKLATSTFCYSSVASTSMADLEDQTIAVAPSQLKIVKQKCKVKNGTSIVVNLSDGTNDMTSITCGTSLTSNAPSSNNVFTEGEVMQLEYGTNTGDSDYLETICFDYEKN